MSERLVEAAGGIVRRPGSGGADHIALVHRPRYDDWSFPKGKLHEGETFEAAALREVREETGLRCALERELESIRYRDPKGRPKIVRYWAMRPVADEGFIPGDEVDAVRWLPVPDAAELLTYDRDRALLRGSELGAGSA